MDIPKPRSRAAPLNKQTFRRLDGPASSLTVVRPETATKPTVDESKVERITSKLKTVPSSTLNDLYLDVVKELGCRQGSCHHSHLTWFPDEGTTARDHPQRSQTQDKLLWLTDEELGYLVYALRSERKNRRRYRPNTPPTGKLRLIADGNLVELSQNVVNELVYRQQDSDNANHKQIEEPLNSGTATVFDYPRNEPQQELSSFFTEDFGGLAQSLLYGIGDTKPSQARRSWHSAAQETEMGSLVSPERISPLGPREDTRRDPFNRNSRFCLDGLVTDKSKFVVACGGYSNVWKGKLGERSVAIKVLRGFDAIGNLFAQEKMLKRLWREYLAWSSLSHPNIIECLGFTYDFVHESQYKVPALISPWMSHGTVLSYIQKNPSADRMNLIVGITQGLCYLHKQDSPIIHGDIRAGNILVSDNGVACFTDFGLARILQNEISLTTSTDAAGSLRWMAPELFNSAKVSEASDVWAYGMTVLEILTGKRPYADIALEPAVLRRVLEGHNPSKPSPSEAPSATKQLWDICVRCWAFRPDDRPSISEIAFEFVTEGKYCEWLRLSDQNT